MYNNYSNIKRIKEFNFVFHMHEDNTIICLTINNNTFTNKTTLLLVTALSFTVSPGNTYIYSFRVSSSFMDLCFRAMKRLVHERTSWESTRERMRIRRIRKKHRPISSHAICPLKVAQPRKVSRLSINKPSHFVVTVNVVVCFDIMKITRPIIKYLS